jgi:hypothetical protein
MKMIKRNTMKLREELQSQGLDLEGKGNHISLDVLSRAMTPEVRLILAGGYPEFVKILRTNDADVAWRCTAMLSKMLDSGPKPLLAARNGLKHKAGFCRSCGDFPYKEGVNLCSICICAVELAVPMFMFLFPRTTQTKLPID